MKAVSIRHLEKHDLSELEWEGEYTHFRRIYLAEYERALQGSSICWVADLRGTGIIGQVFVQLKCDRDELADGATRAYLYAFRIRPVYRGFGLGTRMLEIIEDDLSRRGFHIITLNVARENLRASDLYSRLGYSVTADEPGIWTYPDDQGEWRTVVEPAWRMEKELAAG